MAKKVIYGSKNWVDVVPDEYAIQCIEQSKNNQDRILKFLYVRPICRVYGAGFMQLHGIVTVPENAKGIVILIDDTSLFANTYLRIDDKLAYNGSLWKCELSAKQQNKPVFNKIYHYSGRKLERQKSDENAPDWLKEFAKKHSGNVAYFEF